MNRLVRRLGTTAAAATAVAVSAICAVFLIEPTAHQDDAAQYWVMAGRLARSSDPFYVAAVDHKGPAWVAMYRLGYAVSGDQRWFWLVMAVQVVAFAAVVGLATRWLLRSMVLGRGLSAATASLLTLYLTFGPEGYSNLLYGRNITAALTALAATLAYRSATGQAGRPAIHALVAGAAMGIATQTVFTTIAPTATIGLGLWFVARSEQRRNQLVGLYAVGAFAGLASAAVWYFARGAGAEFQTYFWDYNLSYGQTNTSVLERIGRALSELGLHHLRRPFLLLAPCGLWLATRLRHSTRRPDRAGFQQLVFVGLWWCGELVSVAAPDRWYVHYWILLAAPTACLGALTVSLLTDTDVEVPASNAPTALTRRKALRGSVVGLAAIAALYSVPGIGIGVAAAAGFPGSSERHADRLAAQSPDFAELRLSVGRHSAPDDPVFIWASAAGPYVAVDRPAASRFDRRTWLTGEVYGTDTEVTIPGVWDDLLDDFQTSPPRLIVEFIDEPVNARSPLGTYLTAEFELVEELAIARVYQRRTPNG